MPGGSSNTGHGLSRDERKRLALALALSLLSHAMLLSLDFGGQEVGFPGFRLPWQDRRSEVREVRIVLVAPRADTAEPAPRSVAQPPAAPHASGALIDVPPLASTTRRRRPKATAIVAKADKTAAARPHRRITSSPADAKASPAGDAPGDAAPAAVRERPVIAVDRSDESALVVPPSPPDPLPDIVAASSAEQLEAARVAAERQELARVDAARLETERQEARQQAIGQEVARQDAARESIAQRETARSEAARHAAVQREAAQKDEAGQAAEQAEAARRETTRLDAARVEAMRVEAERQEAAQQQTRRETAMQEAARQEAARAEAARSKAERREALQRDAAKREAARQEAAGLEAARAEAAEREAARQQAAGEAARTEAERLEAARQAAARADAARSESEREEVARSQAAEAEDARREAARQAMGRILNAEATQRAAAAARPPDTRPISLDDPRRGRLLGRADPNAGLVLYAETMARKIQFNTPFEVVRELAKHPHSDPVVTMAIRSDGSVESVTLVRSSGSTEIDEAIRRIVQSHAHYPAFPPELARDFDVIEIRRTWYFDGAVRLN